MLPRRKPQGEAAAVPTVRAGRVRRRREEEDAGSAMAPRAAAAPVDETMATHGLWSASGGGSRFHYRQEDGGTLRGRSSAGVEGRRPTQASAMARPPPGRVGRRGHPWAADARDEDAGRVEPWCHAQRSGTGWRRRRGAGGFRSCRGRKVEASKSPETAMMERSRAAPEKPTAEGHRASTDPSAHATLNHFLLLLLLDLGRDCGKQVYLECTIEQRSSSGRLEADINFSLGDYEDDLKQEASVLEESKGEDMVLQEASALEESNGEGHGGISALQEILCFMTNSS
ncbi:hypothetical protein U9M48_002716 [Paspalum notatum var. saurae]|uniref:Uncharacterized protein n=1 Tax=Paspalum notatum var. saurae TaxID=547442 RepID=A0AAQ3PPP2_PASNO